MIVADVVRPVGPLADPGACCGAPLVCGRCDVGLTRVPAAAVGPSSREWAYADADGVTYVRDWAPPGWGEPSFWEDLAARDMSTYSAWRFRQGTGTLLQYHHHHPATPGRAKPCGTTDHGNPDCVECRGVCTWTPQGWACIDIFGVHRERAAAPKRRRKPVRRVG